MLTRTLTALLWSLTVAATLSFAQDQDDEGPGVGRRSPAWLLATFSHVSDQSFYGTAILLELPTEREGEYLFVTNVHVLPSLQSGKSQRQGLRLSSPIWNYEWRPVRVVGEAPGYDLAVIAVRQKDERFPKTYVQQLIDQIFWKDKSIPALARFSIMGVPGSPQFASEMRPANFNFLWTQRSLIEPTPAGQFGSVPHVIEEISSCPAPLLTRCYRLPFTTSGFSGGALLMQPQDTDLDSYPNVVGIVSHFSPLSALTYVIPWDEVQRVVASILSHAAQRKFVVESIDPSSPVACKQLGTLTWLSPDGDITFVSTVANPGGGPEHIGGGASEHMGGGGLSGSGIDLSTKSLKRARSNAIAYLDHFTNLQAGVTKPASWGDPANAITTFFAATPALRGTNVFLNYRPGVFAMGTSRQQIYKVNQTFMDHLGFLASELKQNYPKKFETEFLKQDLPEAMRLVAPAMGAVSMAGVQRFRTPSEIGDLLDRDAMTTNDTGFEIAAELNDLMGKHSSENGNIDLIVGKGQPQPAIGVVQAALRIGEHRFDLQAKDHLEGQIRLTLPPNARLEQLGPGYFRYAGSLNITWANKVVEHAENWNGLVYGVLTVSQDSFTGDYELKTILATPRHLKPDQKVGFLTDELISFLGLSIPLSVAE